MPSNWGVDEEGPFTILEAGVGQRATEATASEWLEGTTSTTPLTLEVVSDEGHTRAYIDGTKRILFGFFERPLGVLVFITLFILFISEGSMSTKPPKLH